MVAKKESSEGELIALRTQNGRLLDRMELLTRRMEDLEDAVKLLSAIVNGRDRKKCQDPNLSTPDGLGVVKGVEEFLHSQIRLMGGAK